MAYIYAITHTATGRRYVGSAVNLERRWSQHRYDLGKGKHCNPRLQNAWSKYGSAAFEFTVLETVRRKSTLYAREQAWLDETPLKYNLCPVA